MHHSRSILLLLSTVLLMATDDPILNELPITYSFKELIEQNNSQELNVIFSNSIEPITTNLILIEEKNITLLPPIINIEEPLIISKDTNSSSFLPPVTFQDAVQQAKESNKNIFLEVVLDGCSFCEKMEESTLSKKEVKEEIKKNFIYLKINASHQTLPIGLGIQMTPMHVFIDPNENVNDMTFGFMEDDEFLDLLKREIN